jgi:hypothetical protein
MAERAAFHFATTRVLILPLGKASCARHAASSAANVNHSRSPPPPPELAGATVVSVTLLAVDEPAALAHVSEYVVAPAAVGVSVLVPLAASVPVQLPEAVQLVALLDAQVSVVEAPSVIDVAASVRVGATGAATAVSDTDVDCDAPALFAQLSV